MGMPADSAHRLTATAVVLLAIVSLVKGSSPLPDPFNSSSIIGVINASSVGSLANVRGVFINTTLNGAGRARLNYRIEATNVTMFIPELTISNEGIELSNASFSAERFRVKSTEGSDDEGEGEELFDYPALANSVNVRLDPCDNFYEFVCSGWFNSNRIHDDRTAVNQFGIISDRIKAEVKGMFKDRSTFDSMRPYGEQIYALYDACLDNTSRAEAGGRMVLEQLSRLKSAQLRFVTDWLISVFPVSLFYSIAITPDLKNTTKNVMTIQPNPLFFGNEKYYLEEQFDHYIDGLRVYLRKLLLLLKDDDAETNYLFRNISEHELERRVESFITVERELALIQNNTDKHYDNAYADDADMSVQELQDSLAGTINWVRYFETILPTDLVEKFPGGVTKLEVHVSGVEIIRKMEAMARNLSGEVLADIMDWRVILNDVGLLDERYLDAGFEMDRILQGTESRPLVDEECRGSVAGVFTPFIERVYIQRYFDPETRPQMRGIFTNVRDSFAQMLATNEWMDSATKAAAQNKLARLAFQIGYDDSIFNDTKLNRYYSEFALNASMSYAQMIKSTTLWSLRRNMYQLLEPVEIDFPSFSVNGFYYGVRNTMVITAGMLRGSFYNTSRPAPLNYGSIGVVMAHEITHGYDNAGRLHDEEGRVRDWWANETRQNFQRRKQCFIDQYSAIEVPDTLGLHVNGEMTQGENIADNGGMRAAYMALEKFLAEEDSELEGKNNELGVGVGNHGHSAGLKRIRGLQKFNAKQLFFINYAFSWCTKQRSEATIYNVLNDVHAPPDVRVNVVMGNLPEFAEQFHCHAGSKMIPEKRCSVW